MIIGGGHAGHPLSINDRHVLFLTGTVRARGEAQGRAGGWIDFSWIGGRDPQMVDPQHE